MTLQQFSLQEVDTLISGYEKIDFEFYIDDVGCSIDFLVTIDGQKKSCSDLMADGVFSSKAYEAVAKRIAEFARASEGYKPGSVNKYNFSSL